MTLQSSGSISLTNLQTEFGGTTPTGFSEYYRSDSGTLYVTSYALSSIATTGNPISLSQFYGAYKVMSPGTNVKLSIPGPFIAPTNAQVTACQVVMPRSGGTRIRFRIRDVGSIPAYRDSYCRIYRNNNLVGIYSAGTANDVYVEHDQVVSSGDIIKLTIAVQSAEQSQYIDAYLQEITFQNVETETLTYTQL